MVNEMDDLIWRGGVVAWLTNMGHPELASMVANEHRFPSEIKHGHWILVKKTEAYDIKGHKTWADEVMCSNPNCCFQTWFIEGHGHYELCPRCGAIMDGE